MSQTVPTARDARSRQPQSKPGPNGSTSAVSLAVIYQSVGNELAAVEKLLKDRQQHQMPWLDQLLRQTPLAGGKRMRPVLLLLAGGCNGQLCEKHVHLAAAIELVHVATLLHDDVLDNAQTRRHASTVNAIWDNTTSVLLGDYLFAQAFDVACDAGVPEALRQIARATSHVCQGEMKQNAAAGNMQLSESDYTEIITLKTAKLCSCACGLGALASGSDPATVARLELFGELLGVAFQIIDDVLDLVGQANCVGKTLGTDLANQKMTLPLIHGLRTSDASSRKNLLIQLQSNSPDHETVLNLLSQTQSIEFANEQARRQINQAIKCLDGLQESEFSQALRQLAKFVLDRIY